MNTFSNKRMMQEIRPSQARSGVLGQETLEKVLEYRGHVLGPLNRVLDDQAH